MKKIYSLIVLLMIATFSFGAAKDVTAKSSSVQTIHNDVTNAISTIHNDVKDITTTLYGDSKDAVAALYPEVKSAVVSIAKAIGVAAEHVYGVLVKKFVVDGIVQLLPFILGLVLVIIGWIKLSKYIKEHDKIEWRILYPASLILFGIFALTAVDYDVLVMGLVNPEYGALNYILEYSKQMLQ